jgi:hypothetical protein
MLGAHPLLWFRTVLACSFALRLAFASYRPLLACQDLLASPHLLFLCWGFGSSWLLPSLRLLCLAALSCLGVLPTCLCSWLRVGLGGSSVLHWCSRRVGFLRSSFFDQYSSHGSCCLALRGLAWLLRCTVLRVLSSCAGIFLFWKSAIESCVLRVSRPDTAEMSNLRTLPPDV